MSGTISSVLADEMMRAVLPALRADRRATETYTCAPEITVNCPISALLGDSDPKTSRDEARAWSRHTSGSFDLQVFTGGHFFLIDQSEEGHVRALAPGEIVLADRMTISRRDARASRRDL